VNALTLKANAKINLCLHITNIRQDGYHEIDSVFQSIDLFDLVTLKKADHISVMCDAPFVPSGHKNICFKAAERFKEKTNINGVQIEIKKSIPSSAGMGGGSADAAAVIEGLDKLYDCGLSFQEKATIAASIGADVPFFLKGGCCRARGIGDVLSPLAQPFNHDIVIVKPNVGVSTPKAYQLFDERFSCGGSADGMIEAMAKKEEAQYINAVQNGLEACAFILAPKTKVVAAALLNAGAKTARVTGSGAAVFGIFAQGNGKTMIDQIRKEGFSHVFLTHKTDKGISIISQ